MKKLFFAGACLVTLAPSPVWAQTGGADVVVVQLYFTGLGTGHLSLTRATGTSEAATFKDSSTHQEEAAACQRVFAQLSQEGYAVKSTVTRASNLCTWVFIKGQ